MPKQTQHKKTTLSHTPTPTHPGAPLDRALSLLPTQSLASIPLAGGAFVPPVSVRAIARAAVAAATDASVPPGPMDVWTIKQKYGP